MRASPRHFLNKFKWLLAGGWTLVLLTFLIWTLWQQYNETTNAARYTARTAFDKDIVYRRWAALNGGVYAPLTEDTPPNPYLSHLPNRDITTPEGQTLTLINPAYMTRQVMELGWKEYGHRSHITSLTPLRPENAPDPWEKKTLQGFEHDPVEVASLELLDGKEYMRLMRPLATEKSCLKCHGKQGYREGDIRGGISVSVPMAPLWDMTRSQSYLLLFGTGGIWIFGLAGIGFGARSLKKGIKEQEDTTKSLRKSREQLARATEEVETIIDNSMVGIIFYNPEARAIRVNQRFADMLDLDPEQLLQGGPQLSHLLEYLHSMLDSDSMTCRENEETMRTERLLHREDGTTVWCDISYKAITTPDIGQGLIFVFNDITERKELEKLREDVERIMRHDLKTPLSGIIGLPDLILDNDNLNEEQKKYLTLIKEQGYRMLRLTNLSLDLYKMETGAYHYQPQPVNFTKLTELLVRDVLEKIKGKGGALEASVRGAPPNSAAPLFAPAEESLSYSMLSNLMTNAVEASSAGQKVSLRMDEDNRELVITIHNMGAVPEEMRDTFFQKYATQGKKGGTGLGTYSAKLMAETMGGTIAFTSSEAEGTTVTVRLPKS